MDEQRFDELSKKLATSVSRRQAVKILGATAAGGLGALFGARGAFAHHNANCRSVGDNCRANAECCAGACVDFHCVCPGGSVLCPATNECLPVCQGETFFNPDTCECECAPGTSKCGEFTCCPDGTLCCSDEVFGQCCPPDFTCCGFECCPPGFQCDPGGFCVPLCQTAGNPCFFDNDCGQGCQCFGANPPFIFGVCQ